MPSSLKGGWKGKIPFWFAKDKVVCFFPPLLPPQELLPANQMRTKNTTKSLVQKATLNKVWLVGVLLRTITSGSRAWVWPHV